MKPEGPASGKDSVAGLSFQATKQAQLAVGGPPVTWLLLSRATNAPSQHCSPCPAPCHLPTLCPSPERKSCTSHLILPKTHHKEKRHLHPRQSNSTSSILFSRAKGLGSLFFRRTHYTSQDSHHVTTHLLGSKLSSQALSSPQDTCSILT